MFYMLCADLYEMNNTRNDRFSLLNFFMSRCGRLYFPVMASINTSHMHFLHDDFDTAHWKLGSTFLLWVKLFLQKFICWGPDLQYFRTCLYLEIGPRGCQVQMKSLGVTLVVQSLSRVRLFVTPWTAARLASLSFTISQSLLKLLSP